MKLIKKIVFLVKSPFCKRDFERFNIQLLLNNNFEIEVWDITNILNKKLTGNYTPPDPINWHGHKTFPDKRSVLKKNKSSK